MERKRISIPELAIIGGTRAALGAGLGMLLADKLNDERRKGVGWALFALGVASTIPIVVQLARSGNDTNSSANGARAALPGRSSRGHARGRSRLATSAK